MLLVHRGFLLTVGALVLQVGFLGRMEGRQGCQCPHFRLRNLGRPVWGWEGLEKEWVFRSCSFMACGDRGLPLEGPTIVLTHLWSLNQFLSVDWFGGGMGNRWFVPMACSACAQKRGWTGWEGSGDASFSQPHGGRSCR